MSVHPEVSPVARQTLRSLAKKKKNQKVAMLTAYDVVTAQCLDEAEVDILLVGDSLANVVYGFESTLPVTLNQMLAHTAAVVRGSKRALVVGDMPFMSYQAEMTSAILNAAKFLSEAGAQAVKIEGASEYILQLTRRLVESGIPVMGHVGLTPQSVHQMGGFYTHGKNVASRDRLYAEAVALERAGCFAVVLECVEESLAREISETLGILTIGIGSGPHCDGQVLVINDLLGFSPGKSPKFAVPKIDLKHMVTAVAREYVEGVQAILGSATDANAAALES